MYQYFLNYLNFLSESDRFAYHFEAVKMQLVFLQIFSRFQIFWKLKHPVHIFQNDLI